MLKPEVEAWDSASKFDADKDKEKFRQYETACDRVKNFYKEQHGEHSSSFIDEVPPLTFYPEKQTVAFNIKAREDFKKKTRARMSVWQAIELLNTLIDDSDPDVRALHIPIIPVSHADRRVYRRASAKLSISFRPRKPFARTASQSGCR